MPVKHLTRVRTSGFRKARFHKPVCTADSAYKSQLFNHGESCTRGSRQFARNNGSDAGSTSVNRMSSGEFAIAVMKMPTIRYRETRRKFITNSLRIFDKDRTIDDEEKVFRYFCFDVFIVNFWLLKLYDSDFNLFYIRIYVKKFRHLLLIYFNKNLRTRMFLRNVVYIENSLHKFIFIRFVSL